MSSVLAELRNIRTELHGVKQRFEDLERQWEKNQLLAKGLYTGVDLDHADQFKARLIDQDVFEKSKLAKYLLRDATMDTSGPSPTVRPLGLSLDSDAMIFVESGSTFGDLIGTYAQSLASDKSTDRPAAARTNNMLVLTAWTNLIPDVIVEPGSFLSKYYGFFPFSDDKNSVDWKREATSYNVIRRDVHECGRVFATCSRFSFLAGPIVGSRANAIFKHAMHLATHDKQEFVMLFAWNKIVPVNSAMISPAGTRDDCYCVLDKPAWLQRSPANSNGDDWHSKWRKGNIECAGSHFRDGLLQHVNPRPGSLVDADFQKSWLDIAPRVKIVIGLPKEGNQDKLLKDEIEYVNKLISANLSGVKFVTSSSKTTTDHRIMVVEYRQS